MHVSFLVPRMYDRPTGGNIYNRRIITELQPSVETTVVPWSPDADPKPNLQVRKDPVIVVDSLLFGSREAVRTLREAYPTTPIVLLAHYLHCIDPTKTNTPDAQTERALLSLVDGAVTTSRYAKRALCTEGMSRVQIGVAPPGLDASYREPVSEPDPSPSPNLLTVSSLLPGKGLRRFVEQLSSLDDLVWKWTLVGDDTLNRSFADTVRADIRAASITDRVTIVGPVPSEALRAHYDRADLFALPSRFETCSMATREALARGLPVIAYDVGGVAENLGDADAGRLVPAENPDAFTEALRTVLTDPHVRARMIEAARGERDAFPTWAEAAARFLTVLRTIRDASD